MNEYFSAGVILAVGAVLLVLAFVYLDNGGIDYTDENTWEYGDYKEAPDGLLGVSGPLRIVNVGGQEYIYASDTGKGEIVLEHGKKLNIRVEPAQADLIIMDGQSNAAYYGEHSTIPVDPTYAVAPSIGTSFYFGTEDRMPSKDADTTGMRIYDMIGPDGNLRVGDKGPAFCKVYSDTMGKKVVWLSLGIPGKKLSTWNHPNGSSWVQNLTVVDAFKEAMKDVPIEIEDTYLLWAQGESDYNQHTGKATYKNQFKSFYGAISDAWGYNVKACYLIDGRTSNVGWVNTAFEELAEEDPTIHVAVPASIIDSFSITNTLMYADDLHYTQKGDNAVADSCARYVTGSLGKWAGQSPIYLMQSQTADAVGEAAELPNTVTAYNTDGTTGRLAFVPEGTVDTSTAGTTVLDGTATVSQSRLLPNAPAPIMIVHVIDSITINGLTYSVSTTATVSGYTGSPTNVTIPSSITVYDSTWNVVAVGASAFQDCTTITSADLGSVSDVGNSAFYNCTALESVTAPNVLRVGSNGFRGCSALTAIDLPVATTLLGYAFNNDTSLRTVSIPSVTDISGYAFRLCPATVEVTFGPLTGTVTESAFAAWTFYDTDGTTVLAKTASNLADSTFRGTASALVKEATA